jgi:hypothetical protein
MWGIWIPAREALSLLVVCLCAAEEPSRMPLKDEGIAISSYGMNE